MPRKPHWTKELIQRHRFDELPISVIKELNQRYLKTRGFKVRLKYIWLYLLGFKALLVVFGEIGSVLAQFLLADGFASAGGGLASANGNQSGGNISDAEVLLLNILKFTKWIYLFCTAFSLLLLLLDWKNAFQIINSKDIALTFTNQLAYRFYAYRSYSWFCFFDQINQLKQPKDRFALFVFFGLRGWMRLLLVDLPRAGINMATLLLSLRLLSPTSAEDRQISFTIFETILLVLVGISIALVAMTLIRVLVSLAVYAPLILHVRGNLKEYCIHKVEKRIAQLIKYGKSLTFSSNKLWETYPRPDDDSSSFDGSDSSFGDKFGKPSHKPSENSLFTNYSSPSVIMHERNSPKIQGNHKGSQVEYYRHHSNSPVSSTRGSPNLQHFKSSPQYSGQGRHYANPPLSHSPVSNNDSFKAVPSRNPYYDHTYRSDHEISGPNGHQRIVDPSVGNGAHSSNSFAYF